MLTVITYVHVSRAFKESSQWQSICVTVTCFQRIVTIAIYVRNCHVHSENRLNGNICVCVCNCHVRAFRESSQWQYICITVTCFQRIVTMAIYLYKCHVLSENRHNGRPRSSDSWAYSWSLLRLPLHPPC